ncbi:MAG TPA: acyl-CoA dehydrogenase family protein [Caulobacterales bacterium]|nr:acyl-CoA dehydrogenase family protein [Caulobacterales bacterium]
MADTAVSDLEAFRAEARKWLEENHPKSLRKKTVEMDMQTEGMVEDTSDDAKLWKKRIGEKGWGVPLWPKEYGGGGLTLAQARVLNQEMARIGARNPIQGMGPGMFGSTLMEYGSHEQKLLHGRRIAKGEVRWCQGFSEPGAGSDLAGLQTKAEDKGDHYLVNGQKIWTSGAQYADWCFCLVRTDSTKKHEGISFLLIDMHDPGVEVRPILMISGASGQCQTFFTDVKVPKENLMGELNKGWTYAKRLLQFERQGMGGGRGDGAGQRNAGPSLSARALSYYGKDEDGKLADSDFRTRLTENAMAQRAFSLTAQRIAAEARGSTSPSSATSIMKNAGMAANQMRAELTIELMGNRGFGWEGAGFEREELSAVRGWLGGKAGSIFGGTNEVQNNIISKRILTLPESTATQTG